MNAIDILARWAEYSDYDPEQKSFNLLSTNYVMNRISKSVAAINEFDPTGTMGVLYVKQAFEDLCKDVRVRMSELLEHPEEFREDMEMWSLLHSNDIVAVETELLDSIDALVNQTVPTKQCSAETYQSALRRFNYQLSALKTHLNMSSHLSSYSARHTWATMAYYCEIHPGIISEAMGHSSITVTETYLKPFRSKKIDEANKQVLDFVKRSVVGVIA